MPLIDQQTMKIFEIKPENRSIKQLQILNNFFADIAFFKKLQQLRGEQTLIQCLKYLKLEIYEPNSVVLKRGDYGYTFYILLQGQVDIYIKSSQQIELNLSEEQQQTLQIQRRRQSFDQMYKLLHEMIKVNTLGPGQAFGELALLNDAPRMATVICNENKQCIFATLSKNDYISVLAEHEVQSQKERRQELTKVHAFSKLGQRAIQMLLYACIPVTFIYRQYALKEGENFQDNPYIFIIRDGLFKVLRRQSKISIFTENILNRNGNNQSNMIEICNLSNGELFGELESFGQENRLFSVQCYSSSGSVYKISVNDFQKVFHATNENHTIDYIKEAALNKYNYLNRQAIENATNLVNLQTLQRQKTHKSQGTDSISLNLNQFRKSDGFLKQRISSSSSSQQRTQPRKLIQSKLQVYKKLSQSKLYQSQSIYSTINYEEPKVKLNALNKQKIIQEVIKKQKTHFIQDSLNNMQQQKSDTVLVPPGDKNSKLAYWPVNVQIYVGDIMTKKEMQRKRKMRDTSYSIKYLRNDQFSKIRNQMKSVGSQSHSNVINNETI